VHSLNVPVLYLYLGWCWFNERKYVAEVLILITNMSCVYWLNKLQNLLLFWNRFPSTVLNCSRNIGYFFCIRILELVNVGNSESLLALKLGLLLCLFFSSSAGFSLYSLGYNRVYCITGQTCCCVKDGTLGWQWK